MFQTFRLQHVIALCSSDSECYVVNRTSFRDAVEDAWFGIGSRGAECYISGKSDHTVCWHDTCWIRQKACDKKADVEHNTADIGSKFIYVKKMLRILHSGFSGRTVKRPSIISVLINNMVKGASAPNGGDGDIGAVCSGRVLPRSCSASG